MNATPHDTLPDTFTKAEMDGYVDAGRAQRWDIVLPGGRLPIATIVDPHWRLDAELGWLIESGTWYIVAEGDDTGMFRPASATQADVFTDAMQRKRTADDAVARADAAQSSMDRVEGP